MDGKQDCSFRLEDWGIDRWPTLLVTIAGRQRRAKQTRTKRKKPSLSAKEKITVRSYRIRKSKVASPSDVIREQGPAIQTSRHFQGMFISAPLLITKTTIESDSTSAHAPASTPSPSPAMIATPAQHGMINSVFLHDILPYKTALSDPENSWYYRKVQAVELRAIATREVSDAQTLANFMECRAAILTDLAKALSNAGSAAEDDNMDDAQDDNEDDGGRKVYNSREGYMGDADERENEGIGNS